MNQGTSQAQSSDANDEEVVITQLTLAGLKVLMVRKRDQIIYKLPDNMQVSSIGEEQRQQLMKEIQALHAATMAAAANATLQQQQQQQQQQEKAIAPKADPLATLNTPLQQTAAEADAIKETARKLREELEQQQLHLLQQQQQQKFRQSPIPSDNEAKTTRKYIKTGKYSKKRQHLQIQQPQQQQPQPSLSQQQLLSLQQSLQTPSTPTTPIKPTQPLPPPPPPVDSILTKRLPEEELQHGHIKKRFTEALVKDHKSVSAPNYDTPFGSLKDAVERLLPYHIYQYPRGDLDANKIPLDRQDNKMVEIVKCQSDLFEKHASVSTRIEKNGGNISLRVLIERQILAEQRQKMTDEQARIATEQAAQHQELLRIQTEKARVNALAQQEAQQQQQQQQQAQQQQQQAQQQQQQQQQQLQQQLQLQLQQQQTSQQLQQQLNLSGAAANYANGLAQASALLQSPQFANQYSQLSPDLQQQLLRNREQLVALIEQKSKDFKNNP